MSIAAFGGKVSRIMTTRRLAFLLLLAGFLEFWPDGISATPAPAEQGGAERTPAPKPSEAVEKVLDEARRLSEGGQLQESLTKVDEALQVGRQSNDLIGEALAEEVRGDSLEGLQRVEEAAAAWQSASQLWERAAATPRQIEALNALGKLWLRRGLMNEDEPSVRLARDAYARAAETGQRLVPNTPMVVESMHQLGYCEYQLQSSDPAARDHYLEALRIQRSISPEGSMEEVSILKDLGVFESDLAQLTAAHEYLEQAVALGERLGPRSALFEKSLENLALLENDQGDSFSARSRLERALAINREMGGNLGPTYMNLGVVALDQYDFGAARSYFERALALFQETSPNTSGIPFALGNLALTFYREGDLQAAYEYEQRAMTTDEARLGGSLDTADDYVVMGEILRDQKRFEAADEYFHRALDIRQKLTPESLHVADALMDLAKLERARGNSAAAIADDRRALQIGQKSCPETQCAAGTANILNDLGDLAFEQGSFAEAEADLRKAAKLREQSLGPTHPELARSLNSLALTLASLGERSEARELSLRAEGIGAEHLRLSVRTLSERQALAYEGIRASGLDLALSLVADGEARDRAEVLDAVIRSRALVFDELAARRRSVHEGGDPESAQLSEHLMAARRRLATLVYRGPSEATPEVYRALLEDAREKKEKAERALAERSAAFRQEQTRSRLGLDDVARSLPPEAALIAFVRYARIDLRVPGAGRGPRGPVPSYAAFVLRPGKDPDFVRLGPARAIESSVTAWRRDVARQAETQDAFGGEHVSRRLGAALRAHVWDPLVPHLRGVREVLVVPDGALHLVSLGSLPIGESRYLVETRLIHYLSTERDIIPDSSRRGEGILVVGNPSFDKTSRRHDSAESIAVLQKGAEANGAGLRGLRSACGTFRTLQFPALPASQQEVEEVARLWSTPARERLRGVGSAAVPADSGESRLETREDASREAFEASAPGKRVLHLATHGFFLEGSCESALQPRSSARHDREEPLTAENPLLLSGLAFAGANRRSSAMPDESDGILTAEEIAGIDLEGVDWAVLSACDTGVGEIKVGEGVFGLRRAFQIAGAKTVIMSLWPIEDEATRQWMTTLYSEHFVGGKSTPEAVRAATLEALRNRRAKHQSTHPFYWGAFIAAGDWH